MRMASVLYGGKPVLVEGDEEHERRHAERGGDGAGGGDGPPPDRRQHEVAEGDDEGGQQDARDLAEVAGVVVEAGVAGEDEDPEDRPARSRHRRARSTSAVRPATAAVAERVEERRAGITQCASVMRRRYGCRRARPRDLGQDDAPCGTLRAMSDWPPASPPPPSEPSGPPAPGWWLASDGTLLPARAGTWGTCRRRRPPAFTAYTPYTPGAAQATSTNGLAIASMVLGILWLWWIGSILALVFGYVAKGQIDAIGRTSDRQGHGDRGHRARLDRRRRSWRCSSCSRSPSATTSTTSTASTPIRPTGSATRSASSKTPTAEPSRVRGGSERGGAGVAARGRPVLVFLDFIDAAGGDADRRDHGDEHAELAVEVDAEAAGALVGRDDAGGARR